MRRSLDLRLACLLAIGLLVFIASKNTRLSYEHSWMEGHYLTMGRATATLGLFNTGALPIENNALTAPWDTYLDWPPLSVYMLAAAYQVFGDNPLPYHLLFVLFQAMSAWMIGSILRELGYRVGAWFGATVFLSAPVIVNYGFVAGPPAVAEMLFLMAIRLFVGWAKGRWPLWPAPLSAFMATCASWEPLFGFASLLLACLPRDRRNLLSGAVLVASAGFSGCLAVLLLFAVQDPAFASKLVARGLLRAGIGSGQLPHFDVWMIEMLREPRYGLDFVLSQGLRRTMTGLGPVD